MSYLSKPPTGEKKMRPDFIGQKAAQKISDLISGDRPVMIARFGSNELEAVRRGISIRTRRGIFSAAKAYLKGDRAAFWFGDEFRSRMHNNAGFFPTDTDSLLRFTDRMLSDLGELDVLGSWLEEESTLREYFGAASIVPLSELEPYLCPFPWSESLAGQRVLVVHPFSDTVRAQYQRRERLFRNARVLPEFTLLTFKAVQSIACSETRFTSWFEALAWMEQEIRKLDFDVAIVGAGAYGLPLAAFIKRLGRKAIHLGGATQILFGIRGQRWEKIPEFRSLFNEHWVRPQRWETPENYLDVESGCYW